MTVKDLEKIPKIDDLTIQIEQFKNSLSMYATSGGSSSLSEEEYVKMRKLILTNPIFSDIVPKFIKTCRSLAEFWQFIKPEFKTYEERRKFLSDSFNPIIDKVEYESGSGNLEFSRNYVEKSNIGHGGFGVVYLFEHKLLNLPFAVKIFAPAFSEGGNNELERFFQEARMLFLLNHPNIIRIYDAGLMGKRPFIRMEFFDGLDLNKQLMATGNYTLNAAAKIILNIVEGLNYAHKKQIIHRDLKPSNIMISGDEVKIIDFGLGIFIENELYSRITTTGENVISGYYNAPELISNPKLVDKKSDIYSIGAIWFTMLTGQPPAGTGIHKQLSLISNMTEEYASCVKKCLDSFEDRYESCDNLLLELNKLI